MTPTADRMRAAMFTGTLWAAVWHAGRQDCRHYAGGYDPSWLASLPLPGDDHDVLVTLMEDHRHEFERHPAGSRELADAYAARPRTRVRTDAGWGRDGEGTWYGLAAQHLGRLAGEDGPVICSVFASVAGDESLGFHWDAWHGACVQMAGAKEWLIGPGRKPVVTSAGDILILPKRMLHEVTTPLWPGFSVHLSFALDRDPEPAGEGPLS